MLLRRAVVLATFVASENMTAKSTEPEAANGPLYFHYFGWLNRQSMRRRRGQWVHPYENTHGPTCLPKRRLVVTPVNDLMDPLYGDLELAGQRLHRLTSGIASPDKIVTFFPGHEQSQAKV